MGKFIDLTGQRFGRLSVVKRTGCFNDGQVAWQCVCDCGKAITVRSRDLRTGHTRSCGCLQQDVCRETIIEFHKQMGYDGHTQRPVFQVWKDMIRRCYDIENESYKNYGGRGIRVCSEWHDPRSFEQWALDNGFHKGLQLDRKDNEGDYQPNNCRFVSRIENCNNKRTNRRVELDGQEKTLAQWARYYGISYAVVRTRIFRGWTIRDALTKPVKNRA